MSWLEAFMAAGRLAEAILNAVIFLVRKKGWVEGEEKKRKRRSEAGGDESRSQAHHQKVSRQ